MNNVYDVIADYRAARARRRRAWRWAIGVGLALDFGSSLALMTWWAS